VRNLRELDQRVREIKTFIRATPRYRHTPEWSSGVLSLFIVLRNCPMGESSSNS
jgi:hypothetical protein